MVSSCRIGCHCCFEQNHDWSWTMQTNYIDCFHWFTRAKCYATCKHSLFRRYLGKDTASPRAEEPIALPSDSPSPEVNGDGTSDQSCKQNDSSNSATSVEATNAVRAQIANATFNKPPRLIFDEDEDTDKVNTANDKRSNQNKRHMGRLIK